MLGLKFKEDKKTKKVTYNVTFVERKEVIRTYLKNKIRVQGKALNG